MQKETSKSVLKKQDSNAAIKKQDSKATLKKTESKSKVSSDNPFTKAKKKTASKYAESSDEDDEVVLSDNSDDSDFDLPKAKPKKKLMDKDETFDLFKKVASNAGKNKTTGATKKKTCVLASSDDEDLYAID